MVKRRGDAPDDGGNPQEAVNSDVLKRIHDQLYHHVGEAVEPVQDLEKQWTPTQMISRIVRYIYKSASNEELQRQHWRECVKNLVAGAMHGYSSACQEKEWFFEINLIPAFQSAAWELLRANRSNPSYGVLEELIQVEYEEKLDRILLVKAMWDAARHTFRGNDTAVSKVYASLGKTYDVALDEAVADNRPIPDEVRMEHFMKRWINESMQRCWSSFEGSDRLITERSVTKLFGNLVAPFGDEHPFSCVPSIFFPGGERPPSNWHYIRVAAKNMFESWERERTAPSGKRRKRAGGVRVANEDAAAEVQPELHPEEAEDQAASEEEGQVSGDEDAISAAEGAEGVHPGCTSAEDCIGSADDRLVQHVMNGEHGDIYCEACWQSFLGTNSKLHGVFQDSNEPYG